ncbi:MAG: FecR domain-containing protein [Cyclobacteriaceae bacterium]
MNKASGLIAKLLEQHEFKQWVINPSPESDYFWKTWIDKSDERKKAALSAREIILRVRFQSYEIDESWKTNLLDEIIENSSNSSNRKERPITFAYRFWKVAAVVALFIISGIVIWSYNNSIEGVANSENSLELITRWNPPGQKSKINLPDGSVVNLNANSTLKYRKDFNNDRYLELEGEAYFKVERDTVFPFRVNSGSVVTTALGTEFNINTNADEEKISLVEGKIRVDELKGNHSEVLNPNQEIYFKSDAGLSEKYELPSIKSVRWMDGIIFFNNSPIIDVVKTLENWYAVEIAIIGNPNGLTYSGEFRNEYLSNILQSMKFSLGVEYEIEDKNVQLKFNRMN